MAQSRRAPQIATLPRSTVTRTQLEDRDYISRYRTCEATRALAAFVNATGEELEDTESFLSFPRTQSSDFYDSESERSYSTRATTPSDSPAVRSFLPYCHYPYLKMIACYLTEAIPGSQDSPPSIP